MNNILLKELKLSASPITYLFILFGFMFFIPGYPILCGVFFVALGIFYSFQSAREANDIVYSVLLPIAKKDVVKGKYAFVCLIEACAFLLMSVIVLIRMTVLSGSAVYLANPMMNANLFALGCALLIFGLFNWLFVAGFFKTAYKYGRPFVVFAVAAFAVIIAAESLHHIPGLDSLNAFGFEHIVQQAAAFCIGLVCYCVITAVSCAAACRRFETIDL